MMASSIATLPTNTLQNKSEIGISFNPRPNNKLNSIKSDKKVEVRWLETEADLYIRQWQRRYRQLEGINDMHALCWTQSPVMMEHYDDWYMTARSILDIDVAYMNSTDYNKFNMENYDYSFDYFLSRKKPRFMINLDNNFDDDDLELDDDFIPLEAITIDPSLELNQELIAALKSNNLVLKNGKLEYNIKKGRSSEKSKSKSNGSEKRKTPKSPKSPKISKDQAAAAAAAAAASAVPAQFSTCLPKVPRLKNNPMKPRIRSTSRRQMYTCEFPGCSYQSDRNFNFLRHKRTHGKAKNDDEKKNSTPNNGDFFGPINALNSETSFESPLELNHHSNDMMTLTSGSPLISSESDLNLTHCSSTNISDNDQSFSLNNDDYIVQENVLMKNIDNLNSVFADNHFASLSLDHTFMS